MKKKVVRDYPGVPKATEDKSRSFQIMMNRKKVLDQERAQELMKFQQEINVLISLQATQDVRLSQLEGNLSRYEKTLSLEEPRRDDLESGVSYYMEELMRLMEEAKKMKMASERKIETLQQLKREVETYLQTTKLEQERHRLMIDTMTKKMLNSFERMKKIDQDNLEPLPEFIETPAQTESPPPRPEPEPKVQAPPPAPVQTPVEAPRKPQSGHGRRTK